MPGKSQQGRRRQPAQGKKGKGRQGSSTGAAQRQPIAPTPGAAAHTDEANRPKRALSSRATAAAKRYPHISGELRRLGILAGILLAVLVALARVLP